MPDVDLEVEACEQVEGHDPHVWRPDGRRVTARSKRSALRSCPGVAPAPSSMVEAVERFVAELTDPDVALVQLARTLADDLDRRTYIDKVNVAAIAKELRATLADLRAAHDRHDDPAASLAADMSTPVRD